MNVHQPEPEQPRESGPDAMWWISWYSDTAMSAFELHSPWWVSGCDAYGNETVGPSSYARRIFSFAAFSVGATTAATTVSLP